MDAQGGSAHIGGVVFPTDEVLLDRSLLVGNITSVVNTDQVNYSFFAFLNVATCYVVLSIDV